MIVALDIETTGLSKKDCGITQLSMIKVDETKNFKVVDTFDTYVKPRPDALWQPGAMTCSGITPETVENAPSMSDIAQDVVTFIGDCDILTYNGNSFDLPFLKDELQRVGVELALLGRTVYDSLILVTWVIYIKSTQVRQWKKQVLMLITASQMYKLQSKSSSIRVILKC